MLELLGPEHRVTLLTPRPAAGQPPPPAHGSVAVVTYRGRGSSRLGGASGGLLGAASDLLGAASDLLGAASGLARAAASGLPLQSGWFYAADLRRQLRRLAPGADLVVLQLVRLAAHRTDAGATPVLVDLIDDLALNFARRAAVDRWWLRPPLVLEARLLAHAQRRLVRQAAGVLVVGDRDHREMVERLPAVLARRIRTVGLAVEPSGDAPETENVAAVSGEPPRLVFTGNLGYFVNDDAISWWLRDVWPALAARRPDLKLVVAGDRPRPGLRRLVAMAGGESGAVTLVESPPDLRRLLAGAAVALAPMRCGSGVPVKILEAWAQGVPVVASPWAAAGTTGVPGEDLLVASSAREWAEVLSDLLQDPSARRRLAANGRRRLLADCSREAVKAQLLAAVAAARGD
ncbi:MAG TPA: glycosyltransferase family 4 protein [Thermoanaerobaculia bacterium]|nr:glycosyltransferase family 4 protein [Thermoanaerobaculia bacterium]